jgi:non-lysosomal glucosylceramidase
MHGKTDLGLFALAKFWDSLYARAMASYGVFQAVTGFQCHGPKGELQFAPRISPESFRAPFVAPLGWGTFSQQLDGRKLRASIEVKLGSVPIKTLRLRLPAQWGRAVQVTRKDSQSLAFQQKQEWLSIDVAGVFGHELDSQLHVEIQLSK